MRNRDSQEEHTNVTQHNRESSRTARRADMRSASWVKVIVFAVPVIIVVAGVIWASSLD